MIKTLLRAISTLSVGDRVREANEQHKDSAHGLVCGKHVDTKTRTKYYSVQWKDDLYGKKRRQIFLAHELKLISKRGN